MTSISDHLICLRDELNLVIIITLIYQVSQKK